jgi:hypothetical protein
LIDVTDRPAKIETVTAIIFFRLFLTAQLKAWPLILSVVRANEKREKIFPINRL